MKEDIAKKWVAALRSGEYKQGKHCLQKDGEFCCLGVLCDIALKEGVVKIERSENGQHRYIDPNDRFVGSYLVLPAPVVEWANMHSKSGWRAPLLGADKTPEFPPLFEMNDMYNNDFNQIADIVEKEWETL